MPRGSKPKEFPSEIVEAAARLYRAGLSQKEVGEHLGVSQKVVWNLMRRHGIKARVPKNADQRGSKNPNWKGRTAGYQALHIRVSNLRGRPRKCEECGSTSRNRTFDWANMTDNLDDPSDYRRLCRSCHSRHDRKILNIRHMRRKIDASD